MSSRVITESKNILRSALKVKFVTEWFPKIDFYKVQIYCLNLFWY